MSAYEAVFILDSRRLEDGGDAFMAGVAQHIQDLGGTVKSSDSMGRKQFARPIGKHQAGVYWDMLIDMTPDKVAPFKDQYRLNNTVLRLQVFNYVAPPPPIVTKDD